MTTSITALIFRGSLCWMVIGGAFTFGEDKPADEPIELRVETEGFNASAQDVSKVCESAARELRRYFPEARIEPLVVTRGRQGPITLFQRNERKEIVVKLDTSDTYWSQYAYQFAHEYCHVLSGFLNDDPANQWFEETLCETASLFVLRGMARSWKESPPYPHWSNYRDHLRKYADDVIRDRKHLAEIHADGLAAFYRKHEAELQANPTNRDLNGAMAVVLLHTFEERPERWEAVQWLNKEAAMKGETFAQHLRRWHVSVPERGRETVEKIALLYGLKNDVAASK